MRPSELQTLSRIPALFFADRDTALKPITDREEWKSGRSADAPWTFAPQRDAPHGNLEYMKRAHDLTIPWMEAVVRQRVTSGVGGLQAVSERSGWLANHRTGEVVPFSGLTGSKGETSWLPDEPSADGWRLVTGTP